MKIETRITTGKLKDWTIRKSKHVWYALYSSNGAYQTGGKQTLEWVQNVVNELQRK